jgi:hypothetical protein
MNLDDVSGTSAPVSEPLTLIQRVNRVVSSRGGKSPKSPKSSHDSDDEEEDVESVDNSVDDDEEDDSIVAPDDEVELEDGDVPDDTEETIKEHAEVLAAEAAKFIKTELKSDVVNGRTLRSRTTLKKPDDSHHKIIQAAFLLDEKKEIIKECNIWKKKLASEAASKNVLFPRLDVKMSLEDLREEHDKIRIALGLESSSDEEDDDESEDDDSSMSEDEEDDDDESESDDSMDEDE